MLMFWQQRRAQATGHAVGGRAFLPCSALPACLLAAGGRSRFSQHQSIRSVAISLCVCLQLLLCAPIVRLGQEREAAKGRLGRISARNSETDDLTDYI
jgi:hypothetical protein